MKQKIKLSLLIISGLVWAACSNTKYLKPGQKLYTGAEIKINPDSSAKIDHEKDVKATLETKTRPLSASRSTARSLHVHGEYWLSEQEGRARDRSPHDNGAGCDTRAGVEP